MQSKAVIFGCSGTVLTGEEHEFFSDIQPWGFILFGRNIDTPEQVATLVADLKSCVGHDDVPVLIDQEGGRVRRLRPPHWPEYYSGAKIGDVYREDRAAGLRFAWLQSRLMAFDLLSLGINVDCLPVLDVPVPGSHDVIGDRAYGITPLEVVDLGRAAAQGLLDGGVLPVMKHIPGHGRAGVDSHKELPKVGESLEILLETDFRPFRELSGLPMAMTAHVVYEAIDGANPATTSPVMINDIIRSEIGFDGLLMSDDLSMQALSGSLTERAYSALSAGCDVALHCNGIMDEMVAVAKGLRPLEGKALERANRSFDAISGPKAEIQHDLRVEFEKYASDSYGAADPTEVLAS